MVVFDDGDFLPLAKFRQNPLFFDIIRQSILLFLKVNPGKSPNGGKGSATCGWKNLVNLSKFCCQIGEKRLFARKKSKAFGRFPDRL
jgi:hypothetical protein